MGLLSSTSKRSCHYTYCTRTLHRITRKLWVSGRGIVLGVCRVNHCTLHSRSPLRGGPTPPTVVAGLPMILVIGASAVISQPLRHCIHQRPSTYTFLLHTTPTHFPYSPSPPYPASSLSSSSFSFYPSPRRPSLLLDCLLQSTLACRT